MELEERKKEKESTNSTDMSELNRPPTIHTHANATQTHDNLNLLLATTTTNQPTPRTALHCCALFLCGDNVLVTV